MVGNSPRRMQLIKLQKHKERIYCCTRRLDKDRIIEYVRPTKILSFILTSIIILVLGSLADAQYQYSDEMISARSDNHRYKPVLGPNANSKLPSHITIQRNPPNQSDKTVTSNIPSGHQNAESDSRLSKLCQQTSSLLASVIPAPFNGQKRSILCQFFDSMKSSQPSTINSERIVQNQPIYPIIPPLKAFNINDSPYGQQYISTINAQIWNQDENLTKNHQLHATDNIQQRPPIKSADNLNHFDHSSKYHDDLKASSSILDHSYMQKFAGKYNSHAAKDNDDIYIRSLSKQQQNVDLGASYSNQLSNNPQPTSTSPRLQMKNANSFDASHNKSTATSFRNSNNIWQQKNNHKLESLSSATSQRFSVTPSQIQTSGWKVMSNYRKESTPSSVLMTTSQKPILQMVSVTADNKNISNSYDLSSHSKNNSLPTRKSDSSSLLLTSVSNSPKLINNMSSKISQKMLTNTIITQASENKSEIVNNNNKLENNSLSNLLQIKSQSKNNVPTTTQKPKKGSASLSSSSKIQLPANQTKIASPSSNAQASIVASVLSEKKEIANKEINIKNDNNINKDGLSEQRHEEIVIASINNLTRLAFGNQIRDTVRAISKLIDQQQQQLNVNQLYNATLVDKPIDSKSINNFTKHEKDINHIKNTKNNDSLDKSLNKATNDNNSGLLSYTKFATSSSSSSSSPSTTKKSTKPWNKSTTRPLAKLPSGGGTQRSTKKKEHSSTSDKLDDSKILLTTTTKRFVPTKLTTPSGLETRTKVHRVKSGHVLPLNERKATTFLPMASKKQQRDINELNRNSKSSSLIASSQLTPTSIRPLLSTTKKMVPSSLVQDRLTSSASLRMSNWFDGLGSPVSSHGQQRDTLEPFTRLMRLPPSTTGNTNNQLLTSESIINGDDSNSNFHENHKQPTRIINKTPTSSTIYPWSLPDNSHFTEAALSYSSTGDWTTRKSSSPTIKAQTTTANTDNDKIDTKLTTINSWLPTSINVNVSQPINNYPPIEFELVVRNNNSSPYFGLSQASNVAFNPPTDSLTTLKMFLISENRMKDEMNNNQSGVVQTQTTPGPVAMTTIIPTTNILERQETISSYITMADTLKPELNKTITDPDSKSSINGDSPTIPSHDVGSLTRTTPSFAINLDSLKIHTIDVSNGKSLVSYEPQMPSNSTSSMQTNITELEFSPSKSITTTTTTPMIQSTTAAFDTTVVHSSNNSETCTTGAPQLESTLIDRMMINTGTTNGRTTIISRPTMTTTSNTDNKSMWNTDGTTLPHKQFDTMPQTATTGEFFDSETIAQWPERYQTMAAKFTESLLEQSRAALTTKSLPSATIQQSSQDDSLRTTVTTKRTGEHSAPQRSALSTGIVVSEQPESTDINDNYSYDDARGTATTARLYQFLPINHKLTTTSMQDTDFNTEQQQSTTRRQDYEGAPSGVADDSQSRSYESYPNSPYKFSQSNSYTPQGYTLIGEITPSQDGDDTNEAEVEQIKNKQYKV